MGDRVNWEELGDFIEDLTGERPSPGELVKKVIARIVPAVEELQAENARLRKKIDFQEMDGGCLEAENARLRDLLSEIREVYAGSEGIPVAETAAEAYVLRLVGQMYKIAVEALGASDDS